MVRINGEWLPAQDEGVEMEEGGLRGKGKQPRYRFQDV